MTTKREYQRQMHQNDTLRQLGFTQHEADQLRRISMTLQRWFEHECNGTIQRDEQTDKPHAVYSGFGEGPRWSRDPIADREAGARKRLAAIIARVNVQRAGKVGKLASYIQGDPRGAALYIIRPGDVPAGADVGAYYNRGICVY